MTSQSINARDVFAEVIVESPTASYPNFGKVDFSGAAIDGTQLGSLNPVLLDAGNSGGYEDHTSSVSGGSFSICYLREQSVPAERNGEGDRIALPVRVSRTGQTRTATFSEVVAPARVFRRYTAQVSTTHSA